MDRSELEARYPLLRPITAEGAETFLARSESGAIVMVHFLDAPLAAWRGGVLASPERLTPERRERILEMLEVEGRGVVVTRFLLDFRSLPEWLGAAEPTSLATYGATEEFQRLFERAADPPPDALVDATPYSPEADATTEPNADEPPADEPGEFTRLFRAADVDAVPDPGTAQAFATSEGLSTAAKEQLAPQIPPSPPTISDVPPPQTQAGEFTRMFQKLSGGGAGEVAAELTNPPAVPPTPAAPRYPPVEATAAQGPLAGNPSISSVTDADDYRERLYQPSGPAAPPAVPPPPAAPPPPAPPRRTAVDPELPPLPTEMAPPAPPPSPAAGEYTRMVAAQPAPSVPVPIPPAASSPVAVIPEPEQPPRRVGPLIGMAVVVLAALLLIVYLIVRSAGSDAPTDPAVTEPAEAPAAEAM